MIDLREISLTLSSENLYNESTSSLLNGSELDSGWLDMNKFGSYRLSIFSGAEGLDLVIDSSEVDGGGGVNDIQSTTPLLPSFLATLPPRDIYMRFRVVNNSVSTISDVKILLTGNYCGTGASVFPDYVDPAIFSPAILTQSLVRGKDAEGNYRNQIVNEIGATLVSDLGTEIARGKYSDLGWTVNVKYGKNLDIDTTSTPEDMWNGGGVYTGFDATVNADLEFRSTSSQDSGSLVSSGTATGGNGTTLIDSSATFITDGVAVGDCLINDTEGAHGFVTSVDSETQLTVFRMTNSKVDQRVNESGDAYRVATTAGTGCAVVKAQRILNSDFEKQISVYAILNGTSNVTVSCDAYRCSRVKAILSGSSGNNEGTIRVRQSGTGIIFAQMPETGQSTILADTVAANEIVIIKRINITITRTSGAAGSANINLNTREHLGSWVATRTFELQTGSGINYVNVGGIVLTEGTDFKFTVESVSDNNTIAGSELEYYQIEE